MYAFTDNGQIDADSRKAVVTGFFPGADVITDGCYNLAVQFDKTMRFCPAKGPDWGFVYKADGTCYRISVFRLIGYQTYEKLR